MPLTLKDGNVMTLKVTLVPSITGKINRVTLRTEDIELLNKEFSADKLAR